MTDDVNTLEIVRLLDAPPERVWQAWTAPEALARWWWPERFRTTYEVDLRVGGAYRFRTADLSDLGVLGISGTFLEIEPPRRLVYTWRWEHDAGQQTEVTVEFLDRGGSTELRVTHRGFADEQDRENHVRGWNDCLDRLVAYSGQVRSIEPYP